MARRKKPEDQPDENTDQNAGNDDTFGLPEIEYEPINRETTPEPDARTPEPQEPTYSSQAKSQSQYTEEQPVTNTHMERDEVRQNEYNTNTTYYNDDDEGNSPWPKILGIVALLLIIGAAGWYFGWKKPNDTKARVAEQQREQESLDSARRSQELRDAEQSKIAEENQRRADSIASATPTAGTIETLTERTGRYYVVVASAIDGDLLMDYARKLSDKGVNAKVIAPFGTVKFHRLTVAEGETFAATQQTADQLKSEYNDGLWVIKY
jgi:DNA mismatch repair ATPase MutL